MMKNNKFFDDMAKVASGAAGSFMEMKRELETMVHAQVEKILQRMHFATREEYQTVEAMLVKLRTEQEELKKRLETLEKGEKSTPKKAAKSKD